MSKYTIMANDKDIYLLYQRQRNTCDLIRTLRRFNRYFEHRIRIPLHETSHPDTLHPMLVSIYKESKNFIKIIDEEDINISYNQLQISFER